MSLKRKDGKESEKEKEIRKKNEEFKLKKNIIKKEDLKKMLSLKTHEEIWCSSISKNVLRVLDGWIYNSYDAENDKTYDSVFIPDNRTIAEKRMKS
jgi:hypothetical protein